jgi:hypothetical protein
MLSRLYILIFLIFSGSLTYEYYALNTGRVQSGLKYLENYLQTHGKSTDFLPIPITSEPGRPLGLWLGWAGLSLMLAMNVYSLRKRMAFMAGWGRLASWMNFHIFCGLLGPVFILFHCNFKVRGLVAISFWSMVVSFASGLVGRYFFVQISSRQAELIEMSEKWQRRLKRILDSAQVAWDQIEFEIYSQQALVHVGYSPGKEVSNPFFILFFSFVGDIRMKLSRVKRPKHWPKVAGHALTEYALTKRKAAFLDSFRRLMGYWHAFHFPFAVFMYITAFIHVTAALIFGV